MACQREMVSFLPVHFPIYTDMLAPEKLCLNVPHRTHPDLLTSSFGPPLAYHHVGYSMARSARDPLHQGGRCIALPGQWLAMERPPFGKTG